MYRSTSLTRKRNPLGFYHRPVPRALGGSLGIGVFLWARYPCIPIRNELVRSGAESLGGGVQTGYGVADPPPAVRALRADLRMLATTVFRHLTGCYCAHYRGRSLTSKRNPLGPYRRPMPRGLGGS